MRDFCMIAMVACLCATTFLGIMANPGIPPWPTFALLGIAALWAIAAGANQKRGGDQ